MARFTATVVLAALPVGRHRLPAAEVMVEALRQIGAELEN
jgi:hypothetical protein